jgi:DNA-binding transcriptional ArsR family regulator
MLATASSLLDSFSALSDPTRCRMLWLLERQELTVSELCTILQLPQSTVSRHLKMLLDAGWLASRRDGTSRYYSLALDGAGGARTQIWDITRESMADRVGAEHDARRLARVLDGRRESRSSFSRRQRASGIACATSCSAVTSFPKRCSACSRPHGPSAISAAEPARWCHGWRRSSAASLASMRRPRC